VAGRPVPTIWQPVKVAWPEATVAVRPPAFVQLRVPEAGEPLVVARVTVPLNAVTRLLPESNTPTTGEVAKVVVPMALPLGEVVNTNWVADPVESEKVGLEVAPVSPLDAALRL
jgi:hypothetical protein